MQLAIHLIDAAVFPHKHGIEHFSTEHLTITLAALPPILIGLTLIWFFAKYLGIAIDTLLTCDHDFRSALLIDENGALSHHQQCTKCRKCLTT